MALFVSLRSFRIEYLADICGDKCSVLHSQGWHAWLPLVSWPRDPEDDLTAIWIRQEYEQEAKERREGSFRR